MSLAFGGAGSGDDLIVTAPGINNMDHGAFAVVARMNGNEGTGVHRSLLTLQTSSNDARAQLVLDGNDVAFWNAAPGTIGERESLSGVTVTTGGAELSDFWYIILGQKASGNATPRLHAYRIDTANWQHGNGDDAQGNWTQFGSQAQVSVAWEGSEEPNARIGLWAVWNNTIPWSNDGDLENLGLHNGIDEWFATNPDFLVVLDSLPVADESGNDGVQHFTSGIFDSGVNIPGFDFLHTLGETTGAGGVAVGGVAAIEQGRNVVASGGVIVGGEAGLEFQTHLKVNWIPSGGAILGGEADVEVRVRTIIEDKAGDGGVVVGGEAAHEIDMHRVGTGGVTLGGDVDVVVAFFVFEPSGGVVVGGDAIHFFVNWSSIDFDVEGEAEIPTQDPQAIEPPLNVGVEIAFGADPAGNPFEWVWTDVTEHVKTVDGIRSRRGRADETEFVTPSSLEFVLDNDDGRYTPYLPSSPYYGQTRLGTPVRITPLPGSETEIVSLYDDFSRTFTGGWGVPTTGLKWGGTGEDDSHIYVNGSRGVIMPGDDGGAIMLNSCQFLDGTITVKVLASEITSAGTFALLAAVSYRWVGYYLVDLIFSFTGTVSMTLYDEFGGVILVAVDDFDTYADGDEFWLKIFVERDRHRVKAWKVGTPEPSEWMIDATSTGTLFDPSESSIFAGSSGGGFVEGWVSLIALRAGTNDDNEEISFDEVTVVSQDIPLFFGHVAEWEPTWPEGDLSTEDYEGYSRVEIVASGPLRRILQDNSVALQSPMNRAVQSYQNSSTPIRAYWPMEEQGSEVTQFASPLPGVEPMRLDDPYTAGQGDMSTIPGSRPLPQFDESSSYYAPIPFGSYPHGWIVNSLFYMEDQVEGSGHNRTLIRMSMAESEVAYWRIRIFDSGGLALQARDDDWSLINEFPVAFDNDAFYGRWLLVSIRVSLDGADLAGQFTIYAAETLNTATGDPEVVVSSNNDYVASADSAGRPTAIAIGNLQGTPTLRNWGHFIVASIETDFSPDGRILFDQNALSGFDGENSLSRVSRLATEEGVTTSFVMTESGEPSESMGPQRIGSTLLDNFNECEEAGGSILYESRYRSGLVWRERSSLYKQNPKMILDAEAGHVINPFRPILDDQRIVNDVTANRDGGSSSRYIDLAHVLAHGRYQRELNLNVFNDQQLPDIASWNVHVGTQEAMRYSSITPYLSGYTNLIPTWSLLEIGDLVRVTNLPPQHPPDEVDLLAQGFTDSLSPTAWDGQMNTIPGAPWTDLFGFAQDLPGSGICLTGNIGDHTSTPDDDSLDITGDLDIAFDATCTNWTILDSNNTNRRRIGPYKWVDPSSNAYGLDTTAGFPRLIWSENGSDLIDVISRVAVPATGGERAAIRATLDVNNGSGNHEVRFYYAPSMHAVQGMFIEDTGNAATVDRPDFNVGENIDVRAEIITDRRLVDFEPINQDGSAGNRGWRLELTVEGRVRLVWSSNGTALNTVDSVEPIPGGGLSTPLVGGRIAIRAVLIGDYHGDGSEYAVAFFYADSIAGPWIQIRQVTLGTDPNTAGSTSIFDTDASMRVGLTGAQWPHTVVRAEVYNGVAYPYPTPGTDDPIIPTGTLIASPDFRGLSPGAANFSDMQGNLWTLGGDAEISPWALLDYQEIVGTTSIAATDSPLEMGNLNDGTEGSGAPDDIPTPMLIHSGYVKDGIGGTTVANPKFEDLPPGTRAFTDSAGRSWTLNSDQTVICPGATTEDLSHSRLSPTAAYLASHVSEDDGTIDILFDIRRPLNPSPGFEERDVSILEDTDPAVDTFTNFVVTDGVGERVSNRAFHGIASGLFTFDGGSAASVATQAVYGGGTHNAWRRASVWAWAPNAMELYIAMAYLDADSQNSPTTTKQTYYGPVVDVPANIWTRVTVAGAPTDGTDEEDSQAPGVVNTAGAILFVNGTPSAGQQLWLDEFKFGMDAAPFVASHEAPHQFPFDIVVNGEVMRVTAADPVDRHNVQRLYVERGREDSPALSHVAGADIRLYPEPSLAL